MSKQTKNRVSRTSKTSAPSKARKAVTSAASAAAFEMLEDRRLFSALTITGTGLDDVIRVNQTGTVLTVNVNGRTVNYAAMRFTDITVNALGGDDRVIATPWLTKPLTVNGAAGNDHFVGGRANDTFNGGDGNDVMAASRGADEFNGGFGTDTADYSACSANLNVTLDDVANDGMTGEGDNVRSDVENVTGGSGNDTLTGSSGPNYLQGAGGTDRIYGLGGPDTLDGGVGGWLPLGRNTGNDTLFGGDGNDVLHASDFGNNTLNGDAGDDSLYGYGGTDTLDGGLGDDYVSGGNGDDSVSGGAGDDRCFGGLGEDTVDGGSGKDDCRGGAGDDTVYGGAGDDYCDGEAGNDKVYGNYGPRAFPVILNPLPVISVASMNAALPIDNIDIVRDPIIVNPLPPIDLDPIRPINPYVLPEVDLTPRLPKVDVRLIDPLLPFKPVFTIETDNDTVHGGDGEDRVRGDGGNDHVFGDAGDDFCYGDAGNDDVHGGAGSDNVYGGAGDDDLFGDDGDDVLVSIGGGQNDENTGGNGLDSVWCDAEASELDHNDFLSALVEGLAGTHHRVGGFQNVTNGTGGSQTPSRELNGQNLLDPTPKAGATYQNFSDRPLFGHLGPHKDDIDQGGLADCYFLAGLSAVAKQNPIRLHESVVDLGDGTYAVQFFRNGAAEFYRVDGELPANGAGNPSYQNLGHDDSLWAAIMEKAFAFRRTGAGTYASIEYGGADAFNVLNLSHSNVIAGNAIDTIRNLKAALDANKAVIVGTKGTIPAGIPIVGNHMYSVESVSVTTITVPFVGEIVTGSIVVRNPWHVDGAGNSDGANDGYVTLNAADFFSAFDYGRAAVA